MAGAYGSKAKMHRKYQSKKAGGYKGVSWRRGDKAEGKGTSHNTSSGKSIKWY